MHDPKRLLNFPGLLNARDLGGYPTTDGSRTRWRSLLRSDDLAQLTPAGVQALADYGIGTVMDLRWPEESDEYPSPVARELKHVRYVQVSLLARTSEEWRAFHNDRPKELWKIAVLEHVRSELRQALQVIAESSDEPLLFHCVAGKDRTGLIAALMLTLADVRPEAIAYDYAASGENLREAYIRRYADSDPAEIIEAVRCPEEGVHNMLDYLARAGGIHAYLQQIGLSPQQIEKLRAKLRD